MLFVAAYHVGMETLVSNRPASVGRCVLGPLEDAFDLLELSFVRYKSSLVQLPLLLRDDDMCKTSCLPEVVDLLRKIDDALRVLDQRESRIRARHGPV